jgi:hypothetical protein
MGRPAPSDPLGKTMNRETKEILLSKVKSVSHVKHDEEKFHAIFHLKKGIGFNGELTYNTYTFTPIQQDKIPEIKQIIWKRENVFGGSGIITNITFTDLCPQEDHKEYQKLLAPQKTFVGGYHLFPYEFRYLPLLESATCIHKAWRDLIRYTYKTKLARQNFKDVLALQKARYDLKEYY